MRINVAAVYVWQRLRYVDSLSALRLSVSFYWLSINNAGGLDLECELQ